MILTRLAELYDRLAGEGLVERNGYERKPIALLLVLDRDGRLLAVIDGREPSGPGKSGRICAVPQSINRGNAIAPKLLWGNAEYVLGLARDKAPDARRQRRVEAAHKAFKELTDQLAAAVQDDPAVAAVSAFLKHHDPDRFEYAAQIEANLDISFVYEPEPHGLVCERDSVRQWLSSQSGDVLTESQCLVTGQIEPIQRLHKEIRGAGGVSSGPKLVSFDDPAFESYGLVRGANAPIGATAAYAYTTALNWLLSDWRHRLRLGQLMVVFWAAREVPAETFLSDLFGDPPGDETEVERSARAVRVQTLLTAPRSGIVPEDIETDFYVLGLAPNAARHAIASWHEGKLADTIHRVRNWFDDLALVGGPRFAPETLPLNALLLALAPDGDTARLPPRTPAAILRAALDNGRLPEEILMLALDRLRLPLAANSRRRQQILSARYPLTALLRAVLRRNHAMETTVSLDLTATDPAYRWGRLFAVFEKAQEDAQEGINVTVRDRFWASAAATPAMVFGVLSRLNGHHLRKLEAPGRIRFERLIGEIMSGIQDFPSRLSLPEQGRFALGYWHQRTALFTRRDSAAPSTDQAA